MRRILVDYSRKHAAARRGSAGEKVLLEDTMAIVEQHPLDMLALDDALQKLAELDPDQSRLVELRFFGGLSVEETAEVLGVSTATVKRSWSSARAFLHRQIAGAENLIDETAGLGGWNKPRMTPERWSRVAPSSKALWNSIRRSECISGFRPAPKIRTCAPKSRACYQATPEPRIFWRSRPPIWAAACSAPAEDNRRVSRRLPDRTLSIAALHRPRGNGIGVLAARVDPRIRAEKSHQNGCCAAWTRAKFCGVFARSGKCSAGFGPPQYRAACLTAAPLRRGLPYLVMEYVDGTRIDQYWREPQEHHQRSAFNFSARFARPSNTRPKPGGASRQSRPETFWCRRTVRRSC